MPDARRLSGFMAQRDLDLRRGLDRGDNRRNGVTANLAVAFRWTRKGIGVCIASGGMVLLVGEGLRLAGALGF